MLVATPDRNPLPECFDRFHLHGDFLVLRLYFQAITGPNLAFGNLSNNDNLARNLEGKGILDWHTESR